MLLDMNQGTVLEGVMIFPDYVFANVPKAPTGMQETDFITGVGGKSAMSIGGSVNTPAGTNPIFFPGT